MFENQSFKAESANLPDLRPSLPNQFSSNQPKLANPLMSEKKPGKKNLIIIIVASLVFLMAVGAGAFYYYSNIYLTPEKILQTALQNLNKLESGTINYQIELSVKPKESASAPSAASLNFLTAQEFNIKASAKTDFLKNNDFFQTASEILIDIPTGMEIPLVGKMTYSPKISIVSADKENVFLKIEGLPQLPFFDSSQLNNKWIKLNFKELESQYGLKFQPTENQQANKMKESVQKFNNLYKENSFMKLAKLQNEKIDNEDSYHYKMVLDKEIFKKFILGLNKLTKEEGLGENYQVTLEEQLKNLEEGLNKLEVAGEIWITKQAKIIKKAQINFIINNEGYSGEVKNTIILTNYNQPIKINEPTQAMSFKELMDSIMGAAAVGSREEAVDAKIIADVKQTQTALELYFNDNNSYPFPPAGGNRLGIDTTCLGEKGFSQPGDMCLGTSYTGLLAAHPNSPAADYLYYLCADNDYIIEFSISQNVGSLLAGKNYATPSGIFSQNDGAEFVVREVCLDPDKDGLANYFEEKYSTDKNNSDTDGDSYLDGEEVLKGYNPKGPGKL